MILNKISIFSNYDDITNKDCIEYSKNTRYRNDSFTWFKGKRINNSNTHGTGCTLSSAIASNLAKGFDLDDSVKRAKDYISGALSAMLDLGKGSGPMDHSFAIDNEYTKKPF